MWEGDGPAMNTARRGVAGTVQEGGYDLLQLLAAAHLLRIKELAELAAQARPLSHTAPLRRGSG